MRNETKALRPGMSFPLFFRGFVIALAIFAIANYVLTQSAWATFVNTVICGVLIQIGYFLAVLFMIWRSPAPGKESENKAVGAVAEASAKPERKSGSPLPGVGRSRLR